MKPFYWHRNLLVSFVLCFLFACSDSKPEFFESDNPSRLSEWNLFDLNKDSLKPNPETFVYKPKNQLFTDYAHKLRTLWIPAGQSAQLQENEIIYPVGAVLSKTFYYPNNGQGQMLQSNDLGKSVIGLADNTLIETRLFVKRTNGWEAFPYVWNEEQNEAFLRVAGSTKNIELVGELGNTSFTYFIPNENQCSGCHVTEHPKGQMHPLGAIASQLDAKIGESTDKTYTQELINRNWLDEAPVTQLTKSWTDTSASTGERAKAYLNMHCGHCHNPNGAADTSALILDGSHALPVNMGVCKTPIAAGGGAGDRLYSIVPSAPNQSIMLYRMLSDKPDEMMPELGRSLIHEEGIEIIKKWIAEMPGACPTT